MERGQELDDSEKWHRRLSPVLAVLLLFSATANVWLVRSVASLRRQQHGVPGIAVGTTVAPFAAREMKTGRRDLIRYDEDGRPTVFYVFSPQCHWCQTHLPDIRSLAERKGDAYRFVGLSLGETGLGAYVEGHPLPFPVYTGLSVETIRAYRLGVTPQTLVISPEGRVVKSWRGIFRGEGRRDVEAYFGAPLPATADGEAKVSASTPASSATASF